MTIRIGILGAARIVPNAVINPARTFPQVEVAAIAARDPARAQAFAQRHQIPRVYNTYAELVADSTLHVIYNPLPNHLHGQWTLAALRSGKHVLCEKPLAANAQEAALVAETAASHQRLVMEAFHYMYHPAFQRVQELLAQGEIGELRILEAHFCTPLLRFNDIRYRYDLAGGATMDLGCYAVHMLRTLARTEPTVTAARASGFWGNARPHVDRRMDAEMRFPPAPGHSAPINARLTVSFFSSTLLRVILIAQGTQGEIRLLNPILPHLFHRLRVRTGKTWRTEHLPGPSTYTWQMGALIRALEDSIQPPTDAMDALANARVLDAIYQQAGLPLRQPAPTATDPHPAQPVAREPGVA